MNLIIIGCCKRKTMGGNPLAIGSTFFEQNEHIPDLIATRNQLIEQHPVINAHQYMNACDRYDGTVYRKLKNNVQNEIDTLRAHQKLDIIIISALYGAINYDTPINNYDLVMNHFGAGHWAENNVLANSINSYVEHKNIENVYTYLSTHYYAAIQDGLIEHEQNWPIGLHGVINVLNHLADDYIIPKILEIHQHFIDGN